MVAVLGPTASGKSALAEFLASQVPAELINSDASAVYRELSVGVTKPSAAVQREIRYHLLDVATLDQGYSLGEFLDSANLAIRRIGRGQRLPILVGGSSLYSRALLDGYRPPEILVDPETRLLVRSLPLEESLRQLHSLDPETYARLDRDNPRRVARALELALTLGGPVPPPRSQPRSDLRVLKLILLPVNSLLKERIIERTYQMWTPWLEEVDLLEKKGLTRWLEVRKPIGYGAVLAHLRGEMSCEEAVENIISQTYKLAKKQKTWLKTESGGSHHHLFEISHSQQWAQVPQVALGKLRHFLS